MKKISFPNKQRGFIGEVVGSLVGGLLGRSGQRDANRTNITIAREDRAFQERMSNTAYQRATEDLEAAGLNRILALGSPSSSPGGRVIPVQNEQAPMAEGLHKAVNSGLAARRLNQELKNMKAVESRDRMTGYNQHQQGRLATETIQNQRKIREKLTEEIKKTIQDTRTSSAQATIQESNAILYEMLGPVIKTLETVVPGAKGLSETWDKMRNKKRQ